MNLKEYRLASGLKQKGILKDVSLLSKAENGKAILCEADSKKVAKIFGCHLIDIFTADELKFFFDVLADNNGVSADEGKLPDEAPKTPNTGVCKAYKYHHGFIRKCYWLDKTRSKALASYIKASGYETAQEWFSDMVDGVLIDAEFEHEYETGSDYMGKEECKR